MTHMPQAAIRLLCLLAAGWLAGCSGPSADDRLRTMLAVPAAQELTEAAVVQHVQALVPLGTPESQVAPKLRAAGFGQDALSGYFPIPARHIGALRVAFEPAILPVVKPEWVVTLGFDAASTLRTVSAERFLVGP